MTEAPPLTPDAAAIVRTRDYFAEMYVAAVLADAGWDIYFPRRDKGFDMIVSRPDVHGTIVRPVQVKGKYATDEKTDKVVYGYVGRFTAFHDDMIVAMPFFTSATAHSPRMIAWLPRSQLRPCARGWRCEPARFVKGSPEPRPGYLCYFDAAGLEAFAKHSRETGRPGLDASLDIALDALPLGNDVA